MVAVHSGPVRKSVPLTDAQLAVLQLVRRPETPERRALERATGPLPDNPSDARALSSLIDYAARALTDARLEAGYAVLAQTADDDDATHAHAVRGRRHRLDD